MFHARQAYISRDLCWQRHFARCIQEIYKRSVQRGALNHMRGRREVWQQCVALPACSNTSVFVDLPRSFSWRDGIDSWRKTPNFPCRFWIVDIYPPDLTWPEACIWLAMSKDTLIAATKFNGFVQLIIISQGGPNTLSGGTPRGFAPNASPWAFLKRPSTVVETDSFRLLS